MQITEHNTTTGESIVRDATESELKKFESWKEYDEKLEAAKTEIQVKRQALLDKLGITEKEASLLLGGTNYITEEAALLLGGTN